MAEPIALPFGGVDSWGPRNDILVDPRKGTLAGGLTWVFPELLAVYILSLIRQWARAMLAVYCSNFCCSLFSAEFIHSTFECNRIASNRSLTESK